MRLLYRTSATSAGTATPDFNDLAHRRGADIVKTIITAAVKPAFASRKFDMQAAIERLATLPIVEREQQRKAVAKQFGVRASVVDAAVAEIVGTGKQRITWQGAGRGLQNGRTVGRAVLTVQRCSMTSPP